VPQVFLSSDDLGLGIQLVDTLEAAGHQVTWPREPASGPPSRLADVPDAVIVDGPTDPATVGQWVHAWRALSPPPAVILLARNSASSQLAEQLRAAALPNNADGRALAAVLERALQLRFAADLTPRYATAALGVTGAAGEAERAVMIVSRSRNADIAMVREALRARTHHYVTATELATNMVNHRALVRAEIELVKHLNGTLTLGRCIDTAPDPPGAARLLWALTCVGGAVLSPEPLDLATLSRRALRHARFHLRERYRRMSAGQVHYYETLEVCYTPSPAELNEAARRLALRYAAQNLANLDLGDLAGAVRPLWEQIEKAFQVLANPAARAQYNAWLAQRGLDVNRIRAERGIDPAAAEDEFLAGQRALQRGDVNKAISFFAAACRRFPNHSDYECYLAWARYRSSLDRGEDKAAAAQRERQAAEAQLAGRQPRPRALLALGLLCVACEDVHAARWHLNEALRADPAFATARQILLRLGA
jgi:curved DNA-binding protein CbpA/DNA-binding response OmpR family regulator